LGSIGWGWGAISWSLSFLLNSDNSLFL
jgi:hypothetical protein